MKIKCIIERKQDIDREIQILKEELKKKLWGEYLWNPSYFIATVSENIEEQIRNYIKTQKER